ncbi:MAG: bifunctional anthranilate synthase component II/anthranilate phosphoribosyltransferase [Helicobacter sp.]|nr:bifunctional anthranilate synthase component II/anthranilate phosphoribosyltransferase [Helicobacter sp.]
MILLIDNYDSFTFNIYQAFCTLGHPIKVARNDEISINDIKELNPSYIVLGPGPKAPKDSPLNLEIVESFKGVIPILGICLGHQSILSAFGVEIKNAKNIVHGKVEPLIHNQKGIFRNIPQNTPIVRYHSLAGKASEIPPCFCISATSPDGEVMAVEHTQYHLVGLQFHPESIGSKDGLKMLTNFLHYTREQIPVKEYLKKALKQESLNFQESYNLMDELTEGNLSDAQIGSILTSLEIKGVDAYELAGFASVLKKKAIRFQPKSLKEKNFDLVGTGGSVAKTFNVSTTCALALAPFAKKNNFGIIKHGNRAITSQSGSADLLSAFNINPAMEIENSLLAYEELNIAFLFAQKFHAAMRFAANARATLGFKTAFNLIGPLSNPAPISHQLIGVFSKDYTEILAKALQILGTKRAVVVSGLDGIDEVSLCAPTQITELKNGELKSYIFNPIEIGLEFIPHAMLKGGGSAENLAIAKDIFSGKKSPKFDLVALNLGFCLYALDFIESIKDGFHLAKEILINKEILASIEAFSKISQRGKSGI